MPVHVPPSPARRARGALFKLGVLVTALLGLAPPAVAAHVPAVQPRPARGGVSRASTACTASPSLSPSQHALIDLREVENVTDLLRAPSLDVPQLDHLPLLRRQLRDRAVDDRARLGVQDLPPGLRR